MDLRARTASSEMMSFCFATPRANLMIFAVPDCLTERLSRLAIPRINVCTTSSVIGFIKRLLAQLIPATVSPEWGGSLTECGNILASQKICKTKCSYAFDTRKSLQKRKIAEYFRRFPIVKQCGSDRADKLRSCDKEKVLSLFSALDSRAIRRSVRRSRPPLCADCH